MRIPLLLFIISGQLFISCASHHVNNGMMFQKRKYNSGYHFRMNVFGSGTVEKVSPKPEIATEDKSNQASTGQNKQQLSNEHIHTDNSYATEKVGVPHTLITGKGSEYINAEALSHPPTPVNQKEDKAFRLHHITSPIFLDYYWESDLYGFFFGVFAIICSLVALFSVLFFPNVLIISLMLFASWLSAGFAFLIGAFNMFRHAIFERSGEALAAFAFISPLIVALIWLAISILGAT